MYRLSILLSLSLLTSCCENSYYIPITRQLSKVNPPSFVETETALASCGVTARTITVKNIDMNAYGSTGDTNDNYVIDWLRNVANDIERDGWSARTNYRGGCSTYAGPRVNFMLPARPLEGDEIRKLRLLEQSMQPVSNKDATP